MIPTQLQPMWKSIRRNTLLDLDTLFILTDDLPHYNGKAAPFVVMAGGEFFVTPRYMWPSGREACENLQHHRSPELGRATLRDWISACLEANEIAEADKEEDLRSV